jgi:hypothetical protein
LKEAAGNEHEEGVSSIKIVRETLSGVETRELAFPLLVSAGIPAIKLLFVKFCPDDAGKLGAERSVGLKNL